MKIETKYNVGQELWLMKDNKPCSFKIWGIQIIVSCHDIGNYCCEQETSIRYYGYGSSAPSVYEDKAFPTKSALLASL